MPFIFLLYKVHYILIYGTLYLKWTYTLFTLLLYKIINNAIYIIVLYSTLYIYLFIYLCLLYNL